MENKPFHKYRSVWEHAELMERLRRIRHVALDMDGTIYMGGSGRGGRAALRAPRRSGNGGIASLVCFFR